MQNLSTHKKTPGVGITIHRHPGHLTRYFWNVFSFREERLGYTITKVGAHRKINKALKELGIYDS